MGHWKDIMLRGAVIPLQQMAMFREQVADIGRRSVLVVGGGFDINGDAAWTVTLVARLFELNAG